MDGFKYVGLALATVGVLGSGLAQAALYDRGGGLLYDDVLKVTWLQDADYARTSLYDSDGKMDWYAATNWAANLVYAGYHDWRLAATTPVGANWNGSYSTDGSTDYGYNITSPHSELSYMYYVNLGLKGFYSPAGVYQRDFGVFGIGSTRDGRRKNVGPVKNLVSSAYWSGTAWPSEPNYAAWYFRTDEGYQSGHVHSNEWHAWAVRPGDVRPPKNIVVITHGWLSSTKGLPEVKAAVTQRLTIEGILADTLVKDFRWPHADTDFSVDGYTEAYVKTQYAGGLLADDLAKTLAAGKAFDPNYDPTIHLIGHSLGTRVNSFAAKTLSGLTTIEQVTILDAPYKSPSSFYYDNMTADTVKYVDNYIAGDLWAGSSPGWSFGMPIKGTGPCTVATGFALCDGAQIDGQDHLTLVNTWYPQVVNGQGWKSPVLNGWAPDIPWNPAAVRDNHGPGLLQYYSVNLGQASLDVLEGTVTVEHPTVTGPSIITLTPNSPVAFGLDLLVPEQAVLLTFDLEMTKASMGEVQVKLNEEDVWFWYTGDLDNPNVTAEVDVSSFAGATARMTLTYIPHGALDQAKVSNLQFGVSPVPEVPVWALFLAGLIGIAARRRQGSRSNLDYWSAA